MLSLRFENPTDHDAVETLLDWSFGADRRAKTSYRYRDGVAPRGELCFVAEMGRSMVGAIRYWPILLDEQPCLLLGPLAIHPEHKNTGIGRSLITRSLAAAAEGGEQHVFLVGEHAYYRRFGFTIAPPSIVMPGERPERLHWLGLGGIDAPPAPGTLHSWRCLRLDQPCLDQPSFSEPDWASAATAPMKRANSRFLASYPMSLVETAGQ